MKRTGVIIGLDPTTELDEANTIMQALQERYPTCVITVVAGASSLAFEYDDDTDPPFVDELRLPL